MPADRPSLPDLTHQWRQPEPSRDPTWWECTVPDCLHAHRGAPPSVLCPARVAAWGAEQRYAAAAKERAAVVAWLRLGCAWGVLDDYTPDQAADAIEAGDHLEVPRA